MAFATNPETMRQCVERSVEDLPPLPTVISKLLETLESENASPAAVSRIISSDQAISSKVLRVVNSAYYGLPRQVATVEQAIVILGFQQVRNLVLSMTVFSAVKGHGSGMNALHLAFWRHSFGANSAGAELSSKLNFSKPDKELCCMAALLHDIGQLYLWSNFTSHYKIVIEGVLQQKFSLSSGEKSMFSITSSEVGGLLSRNWKFPERLCNCIEKHQYITDPEEDQIRSVVHASNYFVNETGYSPLPGLQDEFIPSVKDWLNLSPSEIDLLKETISEKVRAAEEFFEIL